MTYFIYLINVTEPKYAVDHKRHQHKLYLHPVPEHLRSLGVKACWDRGRRGALRFGYKDAARKVAKQVGGIVEEVSI